MTEQHNDDKRWRHIDVDQPREWQKCWVVGLFGVKVRAWIPNDPFTTKNTRPWAHLDCTPDDGDYEYWMPYITPEIPTESEMQAAREGRKDG